MTDHDPKNARNDQDAELLDELGEDLEVDEDAEAVRGGRRSVWDEEGAPQIE